MAQIEIQRTHQLSIEAAEQAVGRALADLGAYGVAGTWAAKTPNDPSATCTLSGRGVTGFVRIDTDRMKLQISLPLLLRPLTGTIRNQVNERLDQVLGTTA